MTDLATVKEGRVGCPTNSLYGHDQILRLYAGVPADAPIHGRIQHGFTPSAAPLVSDPFGMNFPLYLWTFEDQKNAAIAAPKGPLHVIGSPYLYLPIQDAPPIADSLLAIPTHGIRDIRIEESYWPAYLQVVEGLANRHKLAHVSILLHFVDYFLTPAPKLVGERGFVAICASPGTPGDGLTKGTELEFLPRLRWFLRAHKIVTSDRFCTGAIYAMYEGKPFVLAQPSPYTFMDNPAAKLVSDVDWVSRNHPWALCDEKTAQWGASRLLGERLDPSDLRAIFGWNAASA